MIILKAKEKKLVTTKECARQVYGIYVDPIGCKPAPMVSDIQSQVMAGQVYVIGPEGDVLAMPPFSAGKRYPPVSPALDLKIKSLLHLSY